MFRLPAASPRVRMGSSKLCSCHRASIGSDQVVLGFVPAFILLQARGDDQGSGCAGRSCSQRLGETEAGGTVV